MTSVKITPRASAELDDIYAYTAERWGGEQATRYTDALIACSDEIARGMPGSRPVPAIFGTSGLYRRREHHFIYWRPSDDAVTIVAVLHERMIQSERSRDGSF